MSVEWNEPERDNFVCDAAGVEIHCYKLAGPFASGEDHQWRLSVSPLLGGYARLAATTAEAAKAEALARVRQRCLEIAEACKPPRTNPDDVGCNGHSCRVKECSQ